MELDNYEMMIQYLKTAEYPKSLDKIKDKERKKTVKRNIRRQVNVFIH